MDFSELQEKFGPIFRQYYVPIILGLFGFVFLLYGLISSVLPTKEKGDILFEAAQTTSSGSATSVSEVKQITVDVEGAVLKPGVYKLATDSRVQDALIAAGGMSDKADREKVAKGLNLASKITDGGKIYIPFEGDTTSIGQVAGIAGDPSASSGQVGESTSGLININSATSSELDTLSGVGPATAEKIISNRPYEKIEDLVTKKAVGPSVFEKIKARIAVY
ncbi:MAG TPA: ComEA family DNA-binding protein [Xanthomonadales bacterium]|nr:ComEA family DNA-binding protein [Xanthomonadales bacterium]